ncbi:MAG: hypothetical protein R2758_08185 [Bacteroidales bacterium]
MFLKKGDGVAVRVPGVPNASPAGDVTICSGRTFYSAGATWCSPPASMAKLRVSSKLTGRSKGSEQAKNGGSRQDQPPPTPVYNAWHFATGGREESERIQE